MIIYYTSFFSAELLIVYVLESNCRNEVRSMGDYRDQNEGL